MKSKFNIGASMLSFMFAIWSWCCIGTGYYYILVMYYCTSFLAWVITYDWDE